ncbi:MAG: hypothetical protein AB1478_04615 [Nitrospirota bacterium]
MKKIVSICIFALIVISVIKTNDSFSIERPLKTEEAKAVDVKGIFTLILYGGRHIDDIETIAILDCEGDEYTFEPYAPEFDYKIKRGISAREVLNEAEKFVSFHNSFHYSQLSRIIDKKGNAIGYEMRPLYMPFVFGVSDVIEVDYWLKEGGRVKVNIKLIQSVERLRYPGDGDGDGGGGE